MSRPDPAEDPELHLAMRLLDHAKMRGFLFGRTHTGPDAPLVGRRHLGGWVDTIRLEGFKHGTNVATRSKDGEIVRRFTGDAVGVVNDALSWPES